MQVWGISDLHGPKQRSLAAFLPSSHAFMQNARVIWVRTTTRLFSFFQKGVLSFFVSFLDKNKNACLFWCGYNHVMHGWLLQPRLFLRLQNFLIFGWLRTQSHAQHKMNRQRMNNNSGRDLCTDVKLKWLSIRSKGFIANKLEGLEREFGLKLGLLDDEVTYFLQCCNPVYEMICAVGDQKTTENLLRVLIDLEPPDIDGIRERIGIYLDVTHMYCRKWKWSKCSMCTR